MIVLAVLAIPLGLDLYMPVPEGNPLTREKITLGRELFFDKRLSRDGSVSCASCHDPERAFSEGNCSACHIGPNLTDEQFHNTGVAFLRTDARDGQLADIGAGNGNFKTPTLREVARTAPYMHDGSLATLEDVVEFYSQGGRPNADLDPEIRPRNFKPEEKRALVAFLKCLSGKIQERVH